MNRVLVIYDSKGKVLMQVSDTSKKPLGLMYIEVEVPKGKVVMSVNVETKEAIFADAPKDEVDILNETVTSLEARLINAEYLLMMGGLA